MSLRFILEWGFAGFPHLKKMPHKIYVGVIPLLYTHYCKIYGASLLLSQLPFSSSFVSVFVICTFLSCFGVILFSSLHLYNNNNDNEKQRKSPFVNNKTINICRSYETNIQGSAVTRVQASVSQNVPPFLGPLS